MIRLPPLLAVFAVLLSAPAAAQSAVARGEALAKARCAPCHAVGRAGASPNAKAPPLREVAKRYRAEDLEEAFAEGIMVGHQAEEMPPFELSPREIDGLTAYLRRLRR
ncbi:MAG TPA: cytochrome c [Beijerinckiaceae bacterium]|jgi:mono/diheme cytochrome c family protein